MSRKRFLVCLKESLRRFKCFFNWRSCTRVISSLEFPRCCFFQSCNPSSSTSTWSNRDSEACDDGNPCTRADTCQSGQCTATPFNCNPVCQYCNGNSCSMKTGFGFANSKCMCKIAGESYCSMLYSFSRNRYSLRVTYQYKIWCINPWWLSFGISC